MTLAILPKSVKPQPSAGVTLPVEDGLSAAQLVDLICEAERHGYQTALLGEVAGPEVFSILGAAAARTNSIRLGPGVVASYTRPPTLAAMGFATLASLAPGRIVAGFGASSPIVVGDWHGIPFESPFTTTREYIEIFQTAMEGEKFTYSGERLQSRGFRLGMEVPRPVPIWLGAMGPRMLALAGRLADGVFLTWCPPNEVAERLEHVVEGAEAAGRRLSDIEVICSFWAYSGDRPEVARERMRRTILAYSMVPTHRRCFLGCFPGLLAAEEAWQSGDRRKALGYVTDEVVDASCALGEEAVRARIKALTAEGVNTAIVMLTGAEAGDADGSLQTLRNSAL